MATGKRYFWIKLKDSFLGSDAVDFLMSQPDGANYVVLYQILCLKTINTGGKLERHIGEVIIPYDEAKIQRDARWFTIDTVRVALNLYKALGLIYVDQDGTLALADFDNLVGSETDYAEKNRRLRANQQNVLTGHNVSTDVSSDVSENVSTDIEIRDKRLDIENRDREKEDLTNPDGFVCRTKDVRRIIEAWNSLGLQQVTKITGDSKRGGMLRARVKEYGVDAVLDAIEKVRASAFLQGQNSRNFVITFEWFVKPNNFPKVLEGNYDEHEGTRRKSKTAEFVSMGRDHKHTPEEMDKMLSALDKI